MVTRVTHVLRLFANLLRLLLVPARLYARWAWSRGTPKWISLHLHPSVVPFSVRGTWLQRLTSRARDSQVTSLEELRALARAIREDRAVAGLLVHVPGLEAGWAACEGVRDIFRELRAAGKQVVVYLPEGGGNRELYVALSASRIYIAPYTAFGPLGVAAHPLYIRPLLDKLGIRVEAQAAGEYKSAAEPALRESMSEPAREQLQALLSGTHTALVNALCERGLSRDAVDRLFDSGLLQAKDALALGVVDAIVYEDELREHVVGKTQVEKPERAKPEARRETAEDAEDSETDEPAGVRTMDMDASRYVRWRTSRLWRPLRRPACIAVVPLRGTIVGEQGGRMGTSLRPGPLTKLVRQLRRDASVKGVVFYIDSPGGSALASEVMHREMQRLAQKKPTVACFGDVAASGGYYLACACQKIIAQPLCITGSIGVVSAKVNTAGLLERIGVRPQVLRTARSADMLSFTRGLSADEDNLLRAHAAEIYDRFLTVVAEGRGRSVADIEPLARGRVWTGVDAHERGLVDVLGGIERAISELKGMLDKVPEAQRAALEPRVYSLKAGSGLGLAGVRSWLLGPWSAYLPDLAALDLLRREPVTYYAANTTLFK